MEITIKNKYESKVYIDEETKTIYKLDCLCKIFKDSKLYKLKTI